VDDLDLDAGFGQQPAALPGLLLTEVGQVDVLPPGEEVLGVPGALAVAQEDEGGHDQEG
jgi:hypothetical protein